jgi:NADH dehydrogenase
MPSSPISSGPSPVPTVERQELLNVVIVGGGATGVEVAGVLSEMKHTILPHDYPDLDRSLMNIYLIEAGNRLLSAMSPESSAKAEEFLRKMGVNILLNKMVTDYRDHKVVLADGSEIATRTFIWVSGIAGVQIGNIDKSFLGRGGRIKVDEYNRVPGMEDVFAIGDECIMTGDKNYPNGHPQLAQVSIQQGKLLANNLRRLVKGKSMKPFVYKNLGSMATVGRNKAWQNSVISRCRASLRGRCGSLSICAPSWACATRSSYCSTGYGTTSIIISRFA